MFVSQLDINLRRHKVFLSTLVVKETVYKKKKD